MNWVSIDDSWEAVQLLYVTHHVLLEILWTSGIYLRYLVPSWRKITTPKHSEYTKVPYVPLAIHVIVGTIEVFRYYCQLAITSEAPKPNVVDFGLCLIMAATSLRLAANVRNGRVEIVRTTFQATAVQRMFASALGYMHGDAEWHRASIKLLNNLVWTRLIGGYMNHLQGFRSYGDSFTGAVVVAHQLALWESDYPAGVPFFLAVLSVLLVVDKWASRKLHGK
ncbi:uncharacterized protein LY79DRAFT_546529 [Colletotrichum navitas]|uniref:Uncharacterized protein n=1 Tax=Colletotrichum navitas TaxID=681940 RepID=A0AAD8V733_9PEZI|nr:uncharacterized protein LY79DRAFT_546529 [Colletotrichum navitas]KAK1595474.1 hypothetical protein LY79DRAFT_546529 [Colletotrichum navitas]